MTAPATEAAPARVVVVWCPDWPVVAASAIADVPAYQPAVVLAANRVVACSAPARAEGVRRGLRRREAQARCPELVVLPDDPARDSTVFEPVVAAVEAIAPQVEVLRPGVVMVPARGPVRYFGSEAAVAERLVDHVARICQVECQVGIADGVFAAALAARQGHLVPPGESPTYLASFPVAALDRPELADLLRRLGIRLLGEFAALPVPDVLARFGPAAALAHRWANGLDTRPVIGRRPPVDLSTGLELDPPVDRVDAAAFAARILAERLHDGLARHGLACTRLGIEARTSTGTELSRVWRHEGVLGVGDVADRVRWQLDAWVTTRLDPPAGDPDGNSHGDPDSDLPAGLIHLRLVPEQVVAHAGLQLGLWGEIGEGDERAHRALSRVQSLLGPYAVVTPVLDGGRGPRERGRWVPWGDDRVPVRDVAAPWPGRLPAPSPATVLADPVEVRVLDAAGAPVGVTGRLAVTAVPSTCILPFRTGTVVAWTGPWPVDDRWWDTGESDRHARFQLVVAAPGGPGTDPSAPSPAAALLVVLREGRWWLEGVYD
jgi:protein ImuB